jgi:hypothetical protein
MRNSPQDHLWSQKTCAAHEDTQPGVARLLQSPSQQPKLPTLIPPGTNQPNRVTHTAQRADTEEVLGAVYFFPDTSQSIAMEI